MVWTRLLKLPMYYEHERRYGHGAPVGATELVPFAYWSCDGEYERLYLLLTMDYDLD